MYTLVALSFSGAIGLTFLLLGCALEQYGRLSEDTDSASNACRELDYFFTTGIIQWGACGLVMAGNSVIFLTILGFFLVFGRGDDFSWEQW
ncbi:hypothetical protein CRUP_016700 [Coryphaenoides rupestris]|nr:hypothetical protein CRUP_016700 [Coryphaenoides rupestris]